MPKTNLIPLNTALKKRPDLALPLELVLAHLRLAEEKHPIWPADPIRAGAVVVEEAGELIRACNRLVYENADIEEVIEEAAQTAAMGIRLLMNIKIKVL